MSLSRSGSPSKDFMAVVHLDNLETLQDRWAKQSDGLKHPPPPPLLNSPRSRKACALCGLDPEKDLAKRSLKQHLARVLGDPCVDDMVATLSRDGETKSAMQVAVLAFQRAAIGMGTGKEKLVAYRSFQRQEEQRVPRLASAREVRRQIMSEEAHERRRRRSHAAAAERSSERSNLSGSRRTSASAGSGQRRKDLVVPWSTAVAAGAAADRSPFPSGVAEWRSRRSSRQSSREASASVSPASAALGATAASAARRRSHDSRGHTLSPTSPGRSLNDFTPTVSSDGHLPYVPRNAAALNADYFGNRAADKPVSSPSHTSLAKAVSVREEALGRSSLGGQRSDHPSTSNRRYHSSPAVHEDPMGERRRHRPESTHGDAREESVSVDNIPPGRKHDLSIVSISSSQLGRMLCGGSPDPHSFSTERATNPKMPPPSQPKVAAPAAAVNMFHHEGELPSQLSLPRPRPVVSTDGAAATATPPHPQPNKTSTPPRMAGVVNFKAIIEAKKQQRKALETPPQAAPMPAPATASQVDAQTLRKAERGALSLGEPLVEREDSAEGVFFVLCANPVPFTSALW